MVAREFDTVAAALTFVPESVFSTNPIPLGWRKSEHEVRETDGTDIRRGGSGGGGLYSLLRPARNLQGAKKAGTYP